jgi:hypothetical protein
VRWVMQAHPISVKERWEALRQGLRGGGLPVEDVVQRLGQASTAQAQKLIV